MKVSTSSKSGFTLVEILIVAGIIGLLAAIAGPQFVRAREQSQQNACINNLRQIDDAVQRWALENNKEPGATPLFSDISDYLKHEVVCPAGGTSFSDSYTLQSVSQKPLCNRDPVNHVLPADSTQ